MNDARLMSVYEDGDLIDTISFASIHDVVSYLKSHWPALDSGKYWNLGQDANGLCWIVQRPDYPIRLMIQKGEKS